MMFYSLLLNCLLVYWLSPFSGSKDCGVVHLWVVHTGQPVDSETPIKRGLVSHVQSLEGHSAPITCLEFSESAALLASGCKAGSVRIWDLKVVKIHICTLENLIGSIS